MFNGKRRMCKKIKNLILNSLDENCAISFEHIRMGEAKCYTAASQQGQ